MHTNRQSSPSLPHRTLLFYFRLFSVRASIRVHTYVYIVYYSLLYNITLTWVVPGGTPERPRGMLLEYLSRNFNKLYLLQWMKRHWRQKARLHSLSGSVQEGQVLFSVSGKNEFLFTTNGAWRELYLTKIISMQIQVYRSFTEGKNFIYNTF